MAWFKAASSPRRVAPSELQQMWLSLMSGSWSSIAVVPTDPGTSAKAVTDALDEVARLHDVGPFKIVDAEGASVAEGARIAGELAALTAAGSRTVVAVDSLLQSLSGVPLVRDADAVLLVVRFGMSNASSVQSTIDIVRAERILGSVALPREEPGESPGPRRPSAVEPELGGDVASQTLRAGGRTLVLNGAGVCRNSRKGKVYEGELYLASPSKDATAIVDRDEPKAVRMIFLRTVDQEQIIEAFKKGFENNSRATLQDVAPKLESLKPFIPRTMREGQILSIIYVPGRGTSVGIENGRSGSVEGKEFADAMFRCWLGDHPDDSDLKDGMLGNGPP